LIDEQLVKGIRKQNREAQRKVYELLAKKLYYTCTQYIKDTEDIQEILSDTFYVLFTKIDQLKEDKAFVGWARRIAVNECLKKLRNQVNFHLYLEDIHGNIETEDEKELDLSEEELLNLIAQLPDGCKTVFNLYAIENYSHKEIAKELDISEGTSKSQLNFAKAKLRELITKKQPTNWKLK
jgi:RNA polymerase sigma factor (sigma-70 family)